MSPVLLTTRKIIAVDSPKEMIKMTDEVNTMAKNSSLAIANWFIKKAMSENKHLTQMQLHKLVYFAHALYLAHTDQPLTFDKFKALDYGPVAHELREYTKGYGPHPITNFIHRATFDMGLEIPVLSSKSEAIPFCEKTWETFGQKNGVSLSKISHKDGAPWEQTYTSNKFGVIPNELIATYYRKEIKDTQP